SVRQAREGSDDPGRSGKPERSGLGRLDGDEHPAPLAAFAGLDDVCTTERTVAALELHARTRADTGGRQSRAPGHLARRMRDSAWTGGNVWNSRARCRIAGTGSPGGLCSSDGTEGAELALASRGRRRRTHCISDGDPIA